MIACLVGDYKPGDVLGGKYKVVDVMGRGSNGITYKAWPLSPQAIAPGYSLLNFA
jgi:hypothetical protein